MLCHSISEFSLMTGIYSAKSLVIIVVRFARSALLSWVEGRSSLSGGFFSRGSWLIWTVWQVHSIFHSIYLKIVDGLGLPVLPHVTWFYSFVNIISNHFKTMPMCKWLLYLVLLICLWWGGQYRHLWDNWKISWPNKWVSIWLRGRWGWCWNRSQCSRCDHAEVAPVVLR